MINIGGKLISTWAGFVSLVAWIASIGKDFIAVLPSNLRFMNEIQVSSFSGFLSAVLAGGLLILFHRKGSKVFTGRLALLSFILLVLITLGQHFLKIAITVPCNSGYLIQGKQKVDGFDELKAVLEEDLGRKASMEDITVAAACNAGLIWKESSYIENEMAFLTGYLLNNLLMVLFIISFLNYYKLQIIPTEENNQNDSLDE